MLDNQGFASDTGGLPGRGGQATQASVLRPALPFAEGQSTPLATGIGSAGGMLTSLLLLSMAIKSCKPGFYQ